MARSFSNVSTKGQLVIPAAIREKFGIEPGTRVEFIEEGPRIVLELDTVESRIRRIGELRGITAGGPSGSDMLIEDRRVERQRELREEGR